MSDEKKGPWAAFKESATAVAVVTTGIGIAAAVTEPWKQKKSAEKPPASSVSVDEEEMMGDIRMVTPPIEGTAPWQEMMERERKRQQAMNEIAQ